MIARLVTLVASLVAVLAAVVAYGQAGPLAARAGLYELVPLAQVVAVFLALFAVERAFTLIGRGSKRFGRSLP